MQTLQKLPNFVKQPQYFQPLQGWQHWLSHLDLSCIQNHDELQHYFMTIRYALEHSPMLDYRA